MHIYVSHVKPFLQGLNGEKTASNARRMTLSNNSGGHRCELLANVIVTNCVCVLAPEAVKARVFIEKIYFN